MAAAPGHVGVPVALKNFQRIYRWPEITKVSLTGADLAATFCSGSVRFGTDVRRRLSEKMFSEDQLEQLRSFPEIRRDELIRPGAIVLAKMFGTARKGG